MLTVAPKTVAEWTAALAGRDIPVLASTAATLQAQIADPERVSAYELAETILTDPLMTVRVYAMLARARSRRQVVDITKIEGCIMMLGMPRFIASCENLVTVEDHLAGNPEALAGLMRVVERARNAMHIASRFAVWRNDHAVEELAIAALLHEVAEILVWVFAPSLAHQTRATQRADVLHRSRVAQRLVLNVELAELQHELVLAWNLPQMLVDMMDEAKSATRRVRNVLYAVDIARHCAGGRHSQALVHDFAKAASLLVASPARVRELVESAVPTLASEGDSPFECTVIFDSAVA
jgi:HD-like signal output (HDOD) protein